MQQQKFNSSESKEDYSHSVKYYEAWNSLSAEADRKLMFFSFFAAAFTGLLGVFYQETLIGIIVPVVFLLLIRLIISFVDNRTLKTIFLSAIWIQWVALGLVLTHGLVETRFFFFVFLFILILYHQTLPIIVGSVIATLFMASMYITKINGTWMLGDFVKGYILEESALTYERLNITMLSLIIGCIAAIWLAKLLGSKTRENIINTIKSNENEEVMLKNKEFAVNISNGKLEVEYEIAHYDEMGKSLLEMRNNLTKSFEREKQEKFASQGFAEMGEILRRNNHDVKAMSDEVLVYIVKYVKANQAAIFIVEEEENEGKKLVLTSTYAHNRKKFLNKEIAIGEGLVGQCFLEEEYIYLTNIPETYITITSGLGEASPRSMLIIPLKSNDVVVGIIELASFNPFEKFEIEFLEKLGENIASTILTVKTNERTNLLLKESQELTEQMNAQQEELRQNLEELQATQEEMRRVSAETETQTNIINNIAIVSRTDLKGNITYVNDEFLRWSKYTREEVMGKNHRILKSGDQEDAIFEELWKTISSGKIFRGEIKNKAKDGSFYWVDAIIAPVLDENGKPKEYIAQRFVINDKKEKEEIVAKAMAEATEKERIARESMQELQKVSLEMAAQTNIINSIAIVSKTDLKGNITYVNEEFLRWSKYTKEEVMGKNHRILKSGDQEDAIFEELWKTISSGKIFRGEIKNKAKDGSFYWVDAIIAPVLDENGKPKEYIAQRFIINDKKGIKE